MKRLIVANWKLHKTSKQALKWMEKLNELLDKNKLSRIEIVVCPSFALLPILNSQFSILNSQFSISLGAQDVSKFEEGAYTGEVSAKQLQELVDYVIVGHSERREHFCETDKDVAEKIKQCFKYKLTPIVCISNLEQVKSLINYQLSIINYQLILAYEPLFAVGTGRPDTPQNAQKMAIEIKRILGQNVRVLYGGSVNADNVKSFVGQKDISGVLVGEASLDAEEFGKIIQIIR